MSCHIGYCNNCLKACFADEVSELLQQVETATKRAATAEAELGRVGSIARDKIKDARAEADHWWLKSLEIGIIALGAVIHADLEYAQLKYGDNKGCDPRCGQSTSACVLAEGVCARECKACDGNGWVDETDIATGYERTIDCPDCKTPSFGADSPRIGPREGVR